MLVVGDEDSDCQSSEDVEEYDTPEDAANGLGNIASGILRLTGGHCYHFYAAVCECGIHHCCKKP